MRLSWGLTTFAVFCGMHTNKEKYRSRGTDFGPGSLTLTKVAWWSDLEIVFRLPSRKHSVVDRSTQIPCDEPSRENYALACFIEAENQEKTRKCSLNSSSWPCETCISIHTPTRLTLPLWYTHVCPSRYLLPSQLLVSSPLSLCAHQGSFRT